MIAEATGVHNLKILVVEDNLLNQFIMQESLEREGLRVFTADSGEEALLRSAEEGPDLVLLDLQLPGMDGFAVLRGLREQGFGMPVIALTGYDDEQTRQRCDREGFAAFLSKPVAGGKLLKAIRSCLKMDTDPGERDAKGLQRGAESLAGRIEETITARGYTEENRRRMLEIAPKEIGQHMTAIVEAIDSEDYRTVARETHSLKGSFGALGLMDYHRVAAHMYLAIRIYLDPDAFETLSGSEGLLLREREGVNHLLLPWEEPEPPEPRRLPQLMLEYFRESLTALTTDELSCFINSRMAG